MVFIFKQLGKETRDLAPDFPGVVGAGNIW